jgi:hypothetical protein
MEMNYENEKMENGNMEIGKIKWKMEMVKW